MFEWLRRLSRSDEDAHPPSPAGLPLLGSLREARRNPLHFVQSMCRTCGDISYFRIGPYSGYHLNHPDYVQHVLQANHTNYNKENYNTEVIKAGLGEGLITSSGETWLRQRRLIQPAFHRRRIAQFGSVVTRATAERLDQWQLRAADGQLDVADEMTRLTLRVVGEALFSVDLSAQASTIGPTFAALNEDIAYRFRIVFAPPLWIPTPRNLAFRRARSRLDRIVYGMIAHRRQKGGPSTDLLGMLQEARDEETGEGMTDQQLRDQVMTLMLAGHETTAALLTWTWYLLAKHPDMARILTDEVDEVLDGRPPTVDDLPELPYTERVLQESVRLYPPVWFFNRTAIEDDEIGGYQIPRGSVVTMSPYTMHRHPRFWHNPEDVDPERFAPERSEDRHRYAYIPFGGGPRYCIGTHLAMMEAKLILIMVAQRYRPVLAPGQTVEPEPLVTLRPRNGLQMCMMPRAV